jgi:subtilase family protein/peptidase inhibitor I9
MATAVRPATWPKGIGRLAGVPAKTGRHPGLSVAKVKRDSRATSRVIVVLTNQHRRLPATRRRVGSRTRAVAADQAPLTAQVASSGGRVTRRYRTLNAFAATVSTAERARLAANPAVYKVVPDGIVRLPAAQDASPAVTSAAAPNQGPQTTTCPTDPAKPLLEPEALQTTHTAFNDPNTPSAQQLSNGTGVKVAFFADGLDINNPDFIRDGKSIFIDYKDFSGDGPNAPTGAAEAFGDASSIAAQGNQTYDVSTFVNPSHPVPPGCTIQIRGMAPGASLIGMKVFGNSNFTFDSTVLQGLDYAVSHDHPDILSESFGENPQPDTPQDLTRMFNEQAVAAGITVVESTGDAGVESTIGSAATDPAVIAAGANTNFRGYAQTTSYAFQFSNGKYVSENISSIGSAGFTQDGRVLDLVAPGEVGWALCSPNTAIYEECNSFAPGPSPIQQFGGTSESAPLIAGAAALVIQAYRDTHGGHTPPPALVRQLLTSTATDLGFPSFEEGAGELNSLAAVQAASSVVTPDASPSATGNNLLIDKSQIDITGQAGSTPNDTNVAVTNTGTSTQIVRAHARAITSNLSDTTQTVNLGTAPTFKDQFGADRPYVETTFDVPAGADRLVADDAWPGPDARVGLTLLEPDGTYAAYTRPQGDGNHGEVDVHAPPAGKWTAIVFLRDGSFSGPVHLEFASQKFSTVDSVTPSALTLAAGKTGRFKLHVTLPQGAGEVNQDLEIDGSSGSQSVVPIVLRSLVKLGNTGGDFSGTLVGGNGRAAAPAQTETFDFDVPAGKPELGVTLTFADHVGTALTGTLVDPTGQTTSADVTDANNAMQAYRANPRPGRWRFVFFVNQPVGGNDLTAPFTGHVTFAAPQSTVTGLPNRASKVLKAGKPKMATVTIRNPGPSTERLFLDPRLNPRVDYSLLALTPDTNIALPIAATQNATIPEYIVPTQTNTLTAAAQATVPVTFDWGFGDPHLAAASSGNAAAGQFSAGEAPPGIWFIAPVLVGPFDGPATPGTVSTGMVAHTRRFDLDASPDNGDFEQLKVDPNAPGVALVNVAPGKRGTLTLTVTPSGRPGRTVRGTLYVDALSGALGFTSELLAIPYEYTVG